MSDKLKPCPFCDCEMEIESVGRDWWRIKPVDGHEDACPFGEQHEWDCSQQKPEWKEEHIADWNKRLNHDRMVEEIAELKDSVNQLLKYNGILTSGNSAVVNAKQLLAKLNQEGEQ